MAEELTEIYNVLSDKWFIKFRTIESNRRGITVEVPEEKGHIIAAVADGWFYGAVVNERYQHAITKLFHVSELKNCRFYHDAKMARENEERILRELEEACLTSDVTGDANGK